MKNKVNGVLVKVNSLKAIEDNITRISNYARSIKSSNTHIDDDSMLSDFADGVINSANKTIDNIEMKLSEINQKEKDKKQRKRTKNKMRSYMTVKEACGLTRLSKNTIYKIIKNEFTLGKEYVKPTPKRFLLDTEEFIEYLKKKK